MKALRLRLAVSLIVLLVVLAYALPNIPAIGNSPLGAFMQDRISLGLDLKGGMNLTLGVDVEKAVQNTLSVNGQDIRDRAEQEKITVMKPRLNADGLLEVTLPRADQAGAFEAMMGKWFPNLQQVSADTSAAGRVYVFELSPAARKQTEDMTMEQVVRTIRNRIDQFGVAEPDIRKQSDNQVQVQLPGMTDAERAIQIIGQTAHLEFHIVRDDVDPTSIMLPAGTARYPLIVKGQYGTQTESTIILDTEALMGGEDITNARPAFNEFGQSYVALEFNNRGASNFERITGEHIKKRMAIVLDGKVYSAPVIQDRIAGGKASITGNFTTEEAQDLAIVLRAGSLPTPVSVLEERTVGPSLGKESINSGIKASLVGRGRRGARHAPLLRALRPHRRRHALLHHHHSARRHDPLRRHAHPARHRGHRAHHRHVGGRQRAHLRAHQRRAQGGHVRHGSRQCGLQPGQHLHHRLEPDDAHHRGHSVPVRHGPRPRLRRHAVAGHSGLHVHGRVRFPRRV